MAAFEARAPDVGEDARGLPGEAGGAESLRRSEARGIARGESGTGRCRALSEPGARASCEIYIFSAGNAGGGREGGAEPPSTCQLPARKVPGWRPFWFPPE